VLYDLFLRVLLDLPIINLRFLLLFLGCFFSRRLPLLNADLFFGKSAFYPSIRRFPDSADAVPEFKIILDLRLQFLLEIWYLKLLKNHLPANPFILIFDLSLPPLLEPLIATGNKLKLIIIIVGFNTRLDVPNLLEKLRIFTL
jgi:hypothetical protein